MARVFWDSVDKMWGRQEALSWWGNTTSGSADPGFAVYFWHIYFDKSI